MSLSALSELLSPNRAGEASSDRGAYVPWVRTPSLPVALAVFALFLALELLQRWSVLRPAERAAAAMRELTREARDLRRRAGELSTPSTFAQSAKLARAAVAKEREVEHLRTGQANLRRRGPALAKAALQLSAVAALWGGPVLRAPGPPLGWPLDVLLAARTAPEAHATWAREAGGVGFGTGAIGALPFAVLCGRVASLLARVVLPP